MVNDFYQLLDFLSIPLSSNPYIAFGIISIQAYIFHQTIKQFELMPKIGRKGFYVKKETEKTEIEVFEEFKRRNFSHLDRFNSINDWDLLAIAQHHGLPTRLLDWTENPLVALWFAFATETNNVKNRVVWAFLPLNDEIVTEKTKGGPYNQTETKVFKPRHTNNRIIAQQGWFTVHKFSKNTLVPNVSLE